MSMPSQEKIAMYKRLTIFFLVLSVIFGAVWLAVALQLGQTENSFIFVIVLLTFGLLIPIAMPMFFISIASLALVQYLLSREQKNNKSY